MIRHAARLLLTVMVTAGAGRPLARAQAVLVTGTGDPAIDVPAIQVPTRSRSAGHPDGTLLFRRPSGHTSRASF